MRLAVVSFVWLATVALAPATVQAQARPLMTSQAEVQAVLMERATRAESVLRRFRRARRVQNITPSEARAIFDIQFALAWALVHIDPQPGDANGAVRRWDRNARNVAQFMYFPPTTSRHDCIAPEVEALISSTGPDIGGLRNQLLDRGAADLDEPRRVLLAGLAARRLAADRAADRRARGLSCEDLPDQFTWGAALTDDPQGLWWSINVAMFGEAALPELRAAGEREAASVLPTIFDALAVATPDAIASFLDRGAVAATPSCGARHFWTQDESSIWGLVGFAPPASTWLGYGVLPANPGATAGDLPVAFVVYAEGDAGCDDEHEWRLEIARQADGSLVAGPVVRRR